MKKHWPDCEINNGGKCDCNRKYMTNQPLTIKVETRKEELKHSLERLERLKKRRNWLWVRIKKGEDKDLSYDKAEASALDWAISLIESTLK